jgi:G:T-mismatch repair DNA endonuclease (very short patch repair protein)
MKERIKKEFCCKNCKNNYYSNSLVSQFCIAECRKEYKVKDGKELGFDYVICQICNRATANVTGSHMKNHKEWTPERYRLEFPHSQIIAARVLEKITEGSKKAGARMREPEKREAASKMFTGENNPMHRSKTTEEKRKSISPFSPTFYLNKNPELTMEEAKILADKKMLEQKVVSWVKEEYWIKKGFAQEEAKKIISEKQSTFSLEKCVEKHGGEEGMKIWKTRQDNWKAKVFNDKTHISRGYSKIGEEFINSIIEILNKMGYDNPNILHGKNEKFIKTKEGNVYKYDLTFPDSKKIIEFNGDFWHANPILFEPEYLNKPKKMTANEIWEYDTQKRKAAEYRGYEVFIVWERDYRKNKPLAIKSCLDYILK